MSLSRSAGNLPLRQLAALLLLGYLVSYMLLRLSGTIVHAQGTFFHHVAASHTQVAMPDLVYLPLRVAEQALWYMLQPVPID